MSGSHPPPSPAAAALLSGVVDYAGLFPPAALALPQAVREYARARGGSAAWMLGRFVVPAARLDELAALGVPAEATPWPLSVLGGGADDVDGDGERIAAFSARAGNTCRVEAYEIGARDAAAVEALGPLPGVEVFVEVELGAGTATVLDAIAARGFHAKVRTGGVAADAFPSPDAVLAFVVECVRRRLPFKATAGLHHPLHGTYAIDPNPGGATVPMLGFLNLLLTTAVVVDGRETPSAGGVLVESDEAAVRVTDEGVVWRETLLPIPLLLRARAVVRSFGSCSFREPVEGVRAMGIA